MVYRPLLWLSTVLTTGTMLTDKPPPSQPHFAFTKLVKLLLIFHCAEGRTLSWPKHRVQNQLPEGCFHWIRWTCNVSQGGHSSGKPGKVGELKTGQGKVRENELLQLFSCRDCCSDRNMQHSQLIFWLYFSGQSITHIQ